MYKEECPPFEAEGAVLLEDEAPLQWALPELPAGDALPMFAGSVHGLLLHLSAQEAAACRSVRVRMSSVREEVACCAPCEVCGEGRLKGGALRRGSRQLEKTILTFCQSLQNRGERH